MVEAIDDAGLAAQGFDRPIGVAHHLIYASEGAIGHPQEGKRHFLVGENVDEDAAMLENAVVVVRFRQATAAIAHFCVTKEVTSIGIGRLKRHVLGEFSGEDLHEAVVVGAHHLDVEIVVPRDVTFVAHRSEERTGTQPIAQAVTATNAVDHAQHLRHAVLHTTKVGTFGIKTSFQFPLQGCIGTTGEVERGFTGHSTRELGKRGEKTAPY